ERVDCLEHERVAAHPGGHVVAEAAVLGDRDLLAVEVQRGDRAGPAGDRARDGDHGRVVLQGGRAGRELDVDGGAAVDRDDRVAHLARARVAHVVGAGVAVVAVAVALAHRRGRRVPGGVGGVGGGVEGGGVVRGGRVAAVGAGAAVGTRARPRAVGGRGRVVAAGGEGRDQEQERARAKPTHGEDPSTAGGRGTRGRETAGRGGASGQCSAVAVGRPVRLVSLPKTCGGR